MGVGSGALQGLFALGATYGNGLGRMIRREPEFVVVITADQYSAGGDGNGIGGSDCPGFRRVIDCDGGHVGARIGDDSAALSYRNGHLTRGDLGEVFNAVQLGDFGGDAGLHHGGIRRILPNCDIDRELVCQRAIECRAGNRGARAHHCHQGYANQERGRGRRGAAGVANRIGGGDLGCRAGQSARQISEETHNLRNHEDAAHYHADKRGHTAQDRDPEAQQRLGFSQNDAEDQQQPAADHSQQRNRQAELARLRAQPRSRGRPQRRQGRHPRRGTGRTHTSDQGQDGAGNDRNQHIYGGQTDCIGQRDLNIGPAQHAQRALNQRRTECETCDRSHQAQNQGFNGYRSRNLAARSAHTAQQRQLAGALGDQYLECIGDYEPGYEQGNNRERQNNYQQHIGITRDLFGSVVNLFRARANRYIGICVISVNELLDLCLNLIGTRPGTGSDRDLLEGRLLPAPVQQLALQFIRHQSAAVVVDEGAARGPGSDTYPQSVEGGGLIRKGLVTIFVLRDGDRRRVSNCDSQPLGGARRKGDLVCGAGSCAFSDVDDFKFVDGRGHINDCEL